MGHYYYRLKCVPWDETQASNIGCSAGIVGLNDVEPTFVNVMSFCEALKLGDVQITGLALRTMLRFLEKGLISTEQPLSQSKSAFQLIAESVTKMKIRSSDSVLVENAYRDAVDLLRELVCRSSERLCQGKSSGLTNECMSEIIIYCFRIVQHNKLNEWLRDRARKSLIKIAQTLATNIEHFDDNPKLGLSYKMRIRLSQSSKERTNSAFKELAAAAKSSSSTVPSLPVNSDTAPSSAFTPGNGDSRQQQVTSEELLDHHRHAPYGLPLINDLFYYIASIINPAPEEHNTDEMIHLGLAMLIEAFETAAIEIGRKRCLLRVTHNEFCFALILLIKTTRSLSIFTQSLELAYHIFIKLRSALKYQFEEFLTRLMEIVSFSPHSHQANFSPTDELASAPTTAPVMTGYSDPVELDFKQCALTLVGDFFHQIDYLPYELYYNYDCDIYASNLSESLVKLCSMNCFHIDKVASLIGAQQSHSGTFETLSSLSLDALLSCLASVYKVESCGYPIHLAPYASHAYIFGHAQAFTTPEPQEQKERKRKLWTAIDKFNENTSKGLEFIRTHRLLDVDDTNEMVHFLRDSARINKKTLGEFLSKPGPVNERIREAFIAKSVNFYKMRIHEALRTVLEMFRLPGESQQIERILTTFSRLWINANPLPPPPADVNTISTTSGNNGGSNSNLSPYSNNNYNNNGNQNSTPVVTGPIANEDAALSLSYAIMMLNTDLHNNKRHGNPMTCEQFIKNLRRVNNGGDFEPQLLKEIYSSIRSDEIVLPDEHEGIGRERYRWKALLRKSERCAHYWSSPSETKHVQLADLSQAALEACQLNRLMFNIMWSPMVATISFIFDKIDTNRQPRLAHRLLVLGYARFARLCATYGHLDNLIANLSRYIDASHYCSDKSRRATACMFEIVRDYADDMRTSWTQVVTLITQWYNAHAIDNLFHVDDFALQNKHFALCKRDVKKMPRSASHQGPTFLFAFYSYFAGSSASYDEDSQNDTDHDSNAKPTDDPQTDSPSEDGNNNKKSPKTEAKWDSQLEPLVTILDKSGEFRVESFIELVKALAPAASDGPPASLTGASVVLAHQQQLQLQQMHAQLQGPSQDEREFEEMTIFRLELLVRVILANRSRFAAVWLTIHALVADLSKACTRHQTCLAERLVSAVFRLTISLLTSSSSALSQHAFTLLSTLMSNMQASLFQRDYTAQCLSTLIVTCSAHVRRLDDWRLLLDLLRNVAHGHHNLSDQAMSQLLDIIGTLPERADHVLSPRPLTDVWEHFWCPLMQVMVPLCTDSRAQIRTQALTQLQSALGLHELEPKQLEICFNRVLFRLLEDLLDVPPTNSIDSVSPVNSPVRGPSPMAIAMPIQSMSTAGASSQIGSGGLQQHELNAAIDRTRTRAINLLCKTFLQHLATLAELPTFAALWLSILETMERYVRACIQPADQVREAIPELLKNMLLVMETQGCLSDQLRTITWDKIMFFLPGFEDTRQVQQPEETNLVPKESHLEIA